jgi:hypothetical protein
MLLSERRKGGEERVRGRERGERKKKKELDNQKS